MAHSVLDTPESQEMTEQIDWRAKQPSQAGVKGNDRADKLWREKQPLQAGCGVSEDLKC